MIAPGVPSKPRTPSGYQRRTSSRESISVCLPMASPVAIPLRQAVARSSAVNVTVKMADCEFALSVLERRLELHDDDAARLTNRSNHAAFSIHVDSLTGAHAGFPETQATQSSSF